MDCDICTKKPSEPMLKCQARGLQFVACKNCLQDFAKDPAVFEKSLVKIEHDQLCISLKANGIDTK